MKYLDVINNCKIRIDKEFREFDVILKSKAIFSECHSNLSSYSFENECNLVEITLSFYVRELKNTEEDGIDISIGLFQIRTTENEITSYSSKIKYEENGDLVFGQFLYVTSDICTTTGVYVLENEDHVVSIHDVFSFDKELSKVIDDIFVTFNSNIELMSSKLLKIKNGTYS